MADTMATRLELVQALRLATTPTAKKIELAMSFIESTRSSEESTSAWIKMPQVVSSLSEWVQSALIRSSKPGASSDDPPAHLDSRYWSILKFCLLSVYLHHTSPSLMRPLTSCISASLSEPLKLELIEVVTVLFTDYSQPYRSDLESWVSLTFAALNLLRPDGSNLVANDSSNVALVSAIVEGFSRTVAAHPNPTKVFQSVVARLLEPLLSVIGDSISNDTQALTRVVRAAEEIVENGIFHSSHVLGFFEVCVFLKGNANKQRSYHRTFFQKLDELRKAGNFLVFIGLGRVFKIYAKRWKAQQVALSEDVYGVRGQGKSQLPDSTPGEKAERSGEVKSGDKPEIEAEKDEENVALQPRKHANQTDALFSVFAELLGPLNLEISALLGSENQNEEQISSLMLGVNELLAAAKESEAYKSIEDTLSLTYFNFLQEVHDLTVKIGTRVFDVWSNGDVVMPVTKKKKRSRDSEIKKKSEVIFSEVVFALLHLLELEYRVFEQQLPSVWMFMFKMLAPAVEVMRTTSKGSEFACGLISMYSDLRQVEIPIFHLTNTLTDLQSLSELDIVSVAVEQVVCTPEFLATLGSVIHKLPEGQVANLLRGSQAAVAKSLDSLEGASKFQGSTKGLIEVYICILENANVTSSNSIPVGGAVRELLMKVLAPPMAEFVDEEELCVTTKSVLLLSVYTASRVLHRQCLSLMPPKAARKARISIFDKEIDVLTADETEVVPYLKASGFLMSLQRGHVKASRFLRRVLQKTGDGSQSSAIVYTVNRIAIQSLVDLDRRVWALKFLISKAESKKVYMKTLRSLEKEGARLVSILLRNLAPLEDGETSVEWNKILTSLDSTTIRVARWHLICETVDVWSAFANDEHLKNFVVELLRSGRPGASKQLHHSGEEARKVNLDVVTKTTLRNIEFYEIEGIRNVFSSAFLEELKKALLWSFKEDSRIFRVIDECIQGATPPAVEENNGALVDEKVKRKMKSIDELVLSEEQKKTFGECSRLLNLLASLPCGYLPPADNARCAYAVCQLEIFLVNFLFVEKASKLRRRSLENSTKLGSSLDWADVLIACRRVLDFLANSSAISEPSTRSSDFTRTVFGSSTSTRCLTLLPGIVAMRTQGLDASNVFYSLLNETCAVIEASIANICSAEAKMLVSSKDSLEVERKRKSKKLKGALSLIGNILVTEAHDLESQSEVRQISIGAAMSSTLWSITSALERVDKECRSATSMIWRTELPEAWISIVEKLEPVLVRILLQVLFPNDTITLGFFSNRETEDMEVEQEDKVDETEVPDDDSHEEASDVSIGEESEEEEEEIDAQETELEASKDNDMDGLALSQLESLLEGNMREKSEFVGEIFMALAAVVKLRSLFHSPFSLTTDASELKDRSPDSLDVLLLAAYRLLSLAVPLIQDQKLMNPGWLVGIIKYVGSVGAYLPCMKPLISQADFLKLVNLHLELLGALAVTEKRTQTGAEDDITRLETDWDLDLDTGRSGRAGSADQTDDLIHITQRSFESLLKYAPRHHMNLALQSVEKAIAGVWEGSDHGLGFESRIQRPNVRGCQVAPVIAAGFDCLGLALQAVSGKMRLQLLASHCPTFYGGIFNLVAHCQGPYIFLERRPNSERLRMVDGAPVLLRGLEVLTTLAARAVIFPMKASSVAMALQCPGILFRSFCGSGKSEALLSPWKHSVQVEALETPLRSFTDVSVKLYVACCRLLCALLRHRIKECGHSMASLGQSCRILLHCLAADATGSSLAKASQCGGWLSRVYQEMEAHKESMGKYCCHLLADYLNVISGHSLGGVGLKREVDSALRSGAFALLNACSGNDLQQLHASLGEGARRSALMTLRHDYDLHYKYTGKV